MHPISFSTRRGTLPTCRGLTKDGNSAAIAGGEYASSSIEYETQTTVEYSGTTPYTVTQTTYGTTSSGANFWTQTTTDMSTGHHETTTYTSFQDMEYGTVSGGRLSNSMMFRLNGLAEGMIMACVTKET